MWVARPALTLDGVFSVSVAIASSGAAAVTWEEVTSPSTFAVGVATRPAGGAFTSGELLRDAVRQVLDPSVGVAANGTVTLLYVVNPDTVLRDFPAGGSAQAAPLQPLAASCTTAFGSGIAVAPSGDAVAPLDGSGASFALRSAGSWTVSPTVSDDIQTCPSTSIFHTAVMATIDTSGHPVGVLETHVRQPDFMCSGIGGSDSYTEQLVLPLAGIMTPVPGPPAASGSTFGAFAPFPIAAPQAASSPSGIVFAWGASDLSFRSQAKARFFAADGSGGGADQPVGPEMTGFSAFPRRALAGNGRGLLSWVQPDGASRSLVAAERAVGNVASRSGAVRVAAAVGTAPRLSSVSLTHRRFRVGRRPTPLRGRARASARRRSAVPVGTTFRFTLDRDANVRIGFARKVRGVCDSRGMCVRPTRRLRARRRCALFVPDGTLVRRAQGGTNSVAFSGRLGRRALVPGNYRAGITAAVGGQSRAPVRLTFRIVR